MNIVRIYQTLGPVDIKNIKRDSLLVWIIFLPLVIALIFRIGVPELTTFAQDEFDFDLSEYYPILMSFYIVMAPSIAGALIGFLLLDERDDRIITALMVTPLPIEGYLFYRLSVPIVLGIAMTLIGFPIAGLVSLSILPLLFAAILASLTGSLFALTLATLAENKVAGFAIMKMINGVMLIPSLSFLIDSNWQHVAGIIPTYWALKFFWLATDSAANSTLVIYFIIGLGVNLLATRVLLRRFQTVMFR